MPAAGNYVQTRLIWLVPTITTDATTGEEIQVHARNEDQPYLWASVEELAGRRQTDTGATQTGVDVEIRVRNYPAVNVKDLLKDEYQEYVYRLDSIRNGDDEIVIDAFRYDSLEDYVIDDS